MAVKQYLNNNSCRQVLLAFSVFILAFVSIVSTIDDYGLTWDEPHYIVHSERISEWLGKLIKFDDPFSDEAFQKYWNYDRHHNCHPPFYKLSGIFFRNLVGRLFFHNVLYQYRVSTAFWTSLFLVFLALYFLRTYENYLIAILASLTFLAIPRFFAHMHFFTTDMMVAALAFIALYIFFYDTVEIRRVVLSSIFAGALLATKFTGILMFLIMFSFIFSSRNKEHFFVSYLIFTLLSCVFFLIFNPHSWFGIFDEVLFYFASAVSRDTVVPISTVYFGKVYNYVLPWHHPFVMFGITLPILIPIFLVPGLIWNLRRIKERTSFFESVPLIVLFACFVLPKVPKHDGIRLFSMVWPFLVILFIRGTFVLSRCLKTTLNVLGASASRGTQHFSSLTVATMIVLIVSNIFLSSRDIYHYHPHELSYFNKLIGGPKGALHKGFTISYWFEALNEDVLEKINNLFKHKETKICSYPHYQILKWNNYFGFLDDNIHSASSLEEADYFLFLNRMIPWHIYSELKKNTKHQIAKLEDGTLILGLQSVLTR